MANAKGTIKPGIQINGKYATNALLGSFMKSRKPVGIEVTAINIMLSKINTPNIFQTIAAAFCTLSGRKKTNAAIGAVKPMIMS